MASTDQSYALSKDKLNQMYYQMLLIRKFEYAVKDLFAKSTIVGAIHLYAGEEAVAVGTMANLMPEDHVFSTHRGHGHLIARGVDIKKMMAELYGKETGLCKGKGGSMHMADIILHIYAQPVVGAGLPHAIGAALSAKLDKSRVVSVAFFGDGAANQGCVHESLNLAAIWKLPVIFVCENNGYAQSVKASYSLAGGSVVARGSGYGIPSERIDGMNVLKVYDGVRRAVERARNAGGPTLLECETYRYEGHEEGDPWSTYRTKKELEESKKRDAIRSFSDYLKSAKITTEDAIREIETRIDIEIKEAIQFAECSSLTKAEEAFTDVFSN